MTAATTEPTPVRRVVIFAAVAFLVLYLASEFVVASVFSTGKVSLWYPPAGLVFALVIWAGLPGAVLAVFAGVSSYLLFGDGNTTALSLVSTLISPSLSLGARFVLRRLGVLSPTSVRPFQIISLLLAGAAVAALTALIETPVFIAGQAVAPTDQLNATLAHFLGDFIGMLALVPFLLQWAVPRVAGQRHRRQTSAASGRWFLLMLLLVSPPLFLPLLLPPFPALILCNLTVIPVYWVALRLGMAETSLIVLLFSMSITSCGIWLLPSFAAELQLFAILIASSAYIICAAMTHQRGLLRSLQDSLEERLELAEQRARMTRRLADAEKMAALGQLAGGMAHELNNLLHPINSFARAAIDADADKRVYLLGRIRDCVSTARTIVGDVLAFSHPSLDDRAPAEPVLAEPMLRSAITLAAESLAGAVHVHTRFNCTGVQVRALPTRVAQIMLNLLRNAADAMHHHGTIDINVNVIELPLERAESLTLLPGNYLEVAVRDTGTGMDPATLSRVFEPFFSTKPVGRGTGLGLSLVIGLMRGWQGGALAESRVGEGTTVRLLFPIAASQAGVSKDG
jgi:signal transduction histidine kinase